MTPYYEQDGITIYHGDCREVLPHIQADLVVSDPPYGIAYQSNWRTVKHKAIVEDDALPLDVLALLRLSIGGAIYWFCREDAIGAFNASVFALGWIPRRALVWDKGAWTSGDLEGDWGAQCESIAWAANGRHLLRGSRPSNLLRIARVSSTDHPTEKPEQLLCRIVSVSSDQGQTVLDPFCGSGSLLTAAKRLGRKAVGIEIEERYCELAANRLSQGVLPLEISAPEPEQLTIER